MLGGILLRVSTRASGHEWKMLMMMMMKLNIAFFGTLKLVIGRVFLICLSIYAYKYHLPFIVSPRNPWKNTSN